jgi:hypothetical protein
MASHLFYYDDDAEDEEVCPDYAVAISRRCVFLAFPYLHLGQLTLCGGMQ